MRATTFEFRYQAALHYLLVALAFAMYLFDPDDIVWLFVRDGAHPRLMERLLFAVATVFIGAGAALRTWAKARSASSPPTRVSGILYTEYSDLVGRLLFTCGVAFLAPFWGAILLGAGEAVLVFRLIRRDHALRATVLSSDLDAAQSPYARQPDPNTRAHAWEAAIRSESAKWGMFITMIVFTLLLQDRLAEVLAIISLFVWGFLNCGTRQGTPLKQ